MSKTEIKESIIETDTKHILDKIRAEIEAEKKSRCFDDMFSYITGLDDAIYIIDKYRKLVR